jgi:hypothetical protein
MTGANLLRRLLQVANAGVVTKPLPEFMNLFWPGFGQRFDGWQRAQPAFPIRDDGLHLRLLEHDFRNPDCIGVPRPAPRQVAGMGTEPRQQFRHELRRSGCGLRVAGCGFGFQSPQ